MNIFRVLALLAPDSVARSPLQKRWQETKKTTLYLDLESERDLNTLTSPELFLDQHLDDCVILDEVQIKPEIFPALRASIDKNRVPGRFIILGSSSPNLIRQSSDSLAGRVSYHELSPFNLLEVNDPVRHRIFGGYPECYLSNDDDISREWLKNYTVAYAQKDLPMLGLNTSPTNIMKLLRMISHLHGSILNIEQLSNSMGMSAGSIRNYLDFLEDAFLVRRLRPFHANLKKRLVKSPKLYIRDVGLLHYLLNMASPQLYEFSPYVGNSWEGYAIEQITQLLPGHYGHYLYRTHQGTECDLVITSRDMKPQLSVEIKYSAAPKMTKSYTTAIKDLKTEKNFIVVPREEDYPLTEKVQVLGLEKFIRQIILTLP